MEFYEYTHIEPEIKTIGQLLSRQDEQLIINITAKDFLDVQYEGQNNWNRLLEKYTDDSLQELDNKDFYDKGLYDSIQIPYNTRFFVPRNNIRIETLFKLDTNIVEISKYKGFLADKCKNLFEDSEYVQIKKGFTGKGDVISSNREITVYIWSRALQEWFNISAFVISQDTFVGKNGGNFSLTITPIVAKYTTIDGWDLDTSYIKGLDTARHNDVFTSQIHINKIKDDLLKRQLNFFHTVFQENDLVYIKFEDLVKDKKLSNVGNDFIISAQQVIKHDWDMIGLIDNVPQNVVSSNNEFTVSIEGRDLVKTLIEDGTYFFPLEFAQNLFGNVGDRDQLSGKLIKRLFGELLTINTYSEQSIQFTLQFIFNQLANTGYVDNEAFSGYPLEELTKINRLRPAHNKRIRVDSGIPGVELSPIKVPDMKAEHRVIQVTADGVWRIIKLIIDESARDRRVVDNSIAREQGSLINFVRKVVQEPFVEFFTDTYGNKFYFVVRKPPFDKEGMLSLAYNQSVSTEGYSSVPIDIKKNQVYDAKRTHVAGVGNVYVLPEGTGVTTTDNFRTDYKISDLTLTINEEDVLQEDLSYDKEVYSWYYLNPKGFLWGTDQALTLSWLPAVSFEEYVNIWGSKPLNLTTNYISFRAVNDKSYKDRVNYFEGQAINDLKYMIDSSQYLPFSRRGSIMIHGDRRFKRGMFVYYAPTEEVFYVDAVRNRRAINSKITDRTTVLTVIRGMRKKYIVGVDGISYFNIINSDVSGIAVGETAQKVVKDWRVNSDVFEFFVNRRQWE
jgi:hypothetical protein